MSRNLSNRGWNTSSIASKMKILPSTGGSLTSRGFPSTTDYSKSTTQTPVNFRSGLGTGGGGGGKSSALKSLTDLSQFIPGNNVYDLKKQMAQDAYNRGMAALNAAYGEYMSALSGNLDSTKGALLDSYNRSKKSIMDDSKSSLKQAYINKRLSEKNLDQQMSAQGLSGGATETTRASMSNNYGNARNEINTTTNNNLSNLEGEYNQNLADAMQAYNMAVANAQLQKAQQVMALEEALANNQIAALDDFGSLMAGDQESYLQALQSALDNRGTAEFNPTSANNAPKSYEYNQQDNIPIDSRTSGNLEAALQAITTATRGTPYTPPYVNNALASALANFARTMPTTPAPLSNSAAIAKNLANFARTYGR